MLSNLVLDLFYWTDGWRRSVSLLIGSAGEEIFDLVVLRKKYLGGCQISSSKIKFRQINEKCFSIWSWTYSTELRAGRGVYPSY